MRTMAIAACCIVFSCTAFAFKFRTYTLSEQLVASDAVIVGLVEQSNCISRVTNAKYIKGAGADSVEIKYNFRRECDRPEFHDGEKVLLFAKEANNGARELVGYGDQSVWPKKRAKWPFCELHVSSEAAVEGVVEKIVELENITSGVAKCSGVREILCSTNLFEKAIVMEYLDLGKNEGIRVPLKAELETAISNGGDPYIVKLGCSITNKIMQTVKRPSDCEKIALLADDHKKVVVNIKEFKDSEKEFKSYLDSTGLGAMMSNDKGELIGGLFWSDAAWIMWQKNIFLPTNDSDRAEWRWPTNVPVGKLQTQVCASKAPLFDILIAGDVIAKGEVKQYNSYREQRESFLNKYSGPANSSRPPSFIFTFAQRLDVSYLGAETNMLYITERGSRDDSLTYKNITLNIRYTDDSLAKHRKAIAVALMNAGAVLKPRDHIDSVSGRVADKEAVEGEKKKDLKENAETRTVK